MKKRIIALLLCVAMLFSGCVKAPENPVTPPFYKITDSNSGGAAYLLGTMHVGVQNTVYPQTMYDALSQSDALVVEVDLIALDNDKKRLSEAMKLLECSEKSTKEMLGADYERTRDFFKGKRLYNAVFERYIPAVWSSTLTTKLAKECGYSPDYGTDRALLSYAMKHSLEIRELETVEEQYAVNANESEALQVYALVSSVDTAWETQKQQTCDLYESWSRGDLAALEQMIHEDEPPAELAADYEDFYFAMYENRQRKMAEYISEALKDGETIFVAVGALHLAAAPDILELLEAEGYKIEKLAGCR